MRNDGCNAGLSTGSFGGFRTRTVVPWYPDFFNGGDVYCICPIDLGVIRSYFQARKEVTRPEFLRGRGVPRPLLLSLVVGTGFAFLSMGVKLYRA